MVSKTQLEKRKKRKTNKELINLVNILKKQKSPLWQTVIKYLTAPTRKAVAVNIEKINKLTKNNEIAIVPGKVLGKGNLDHEAIVVAFKFSEKARKKLAEKANLMTIYDFIGKQSDFKNIPIKIII